MFFIGNVRLENRLIMAPMAGITNLPFRMMVKKLGAGLVTSEMISAMGLVLGDKKTRDYLKSHPFERPLAVQIFGARPEAMALAAEIAVENGADIIDINMGCPAKKVIKTGAGGALLNDLTKVRQILTAVRRVCYVPLTVKIRSGWAAGGTAAEEIGLMVEDCGADALTVHPRFVTQGFSGCADWDVILRVKRRLKIPVIGNGDIVSPEHAQHIRSQTGCDGVMIGRAAVGNPWIFKQILALENGGKTAAPLLSERKDLIVEHYALLSQIKGELRAARDMRGILISYTKGLPKSRCFRGAFTKISGLDTLVSAIDSYFSFLEGRSNAGDLIS
ncbi:tRNA-dihydrouridine synthase B [uncultured Desulfobacterium sp.]|uniref:tRNA-dihydrouridine synthase n=1 Tax=uncultured Desulfobacterium sp. TaxID=201089 RepID=A0A445MVL2_9BACT|nr:tRNA-dihydrouridine synthase B [uncultured Desulfobacterium sp.]